MKSQFKNGEEFFFKLNQVFHLILAFSLLPFGIIFLYKKEHTSASAENDLITIVILGVLVLLMGFLVFQSIVTYKKSFKKLSEDWRLRKKMTFYYDINYHRFKYVGYATFLAVAGYFLDNGFLFAILYGILIFLMSLWRPTERKIEEQLRLDPEEKKTLRQREDIA